MYVTVFLFLRIELRSLGKIAEGEELTVAYVDFLNLSEDRKKLLKTQYFFDCTCEHCNGHIKDDLKMGGKEGEDGVKVCVCFVHREDTLYCTRQRDQTLTTFSTDMCDEDRRET